MAYVPPLNGGRINMYDGTNSISTGTVRLSNANGVSFGINGQTLTASHNALTSQSGQAFTAGNGSFAFQTALFSNGNGISFSSTVTNGSSGIIASHNGLTTARASNDAIGLNTAQTNVTWTADSRGISLNAGGYAGTGFSGTNASGTLNSNGLQLSVGAGGGGGGVVLNDGVNSITTGAARISGGGALTASINGQTLSLNAPPVSSVSATGAVSISTNGSTVSIGAPAFSVGISSNSTVSNQLILAAGNNITLSQSTNATGATVSVGANGVLTSQSSQIISAGNGSFAFQTVSFSNANGVSFSTTANGGTSGIVASLNTTGYAGTGFSGTNASGTLNSNGLQLSVGAGGGGGGIALYDGVNSINTGTARISGGGALTASVNGQVLSLNAPPVSSLSVTGALSISTSGNTISMGAPQTSSLVGTGGVFISANGSTISIGAMPTLSRWEYPSAVFTAMPAIVNNSLSLQHAYIPFNVSATEMKVGGSFSAATHTSASTGSITVNLKMALYTLNGSTLSLATSGSGSTAFGVSSNATSSINGMRQFTVTANSINITPGEYWVAAILSTATNYASNSMTFTLYGNTAVPSIASNAILSPMGSAVTASPRDVFLFEGMYGTVTTAFPAAIQGSQINNSAASNVERAQFYHAIYNATY